MKIIGSFSTFLSSRFAWSVNKLSIAKTSFNKNRHPVPENGVITLPGYYYLQENLVTKDSEAISINANNVVLDLCGNSVIAQDGPDEEKPNTAIIVRRGYNVKISNGVIKGFYNGVVLSGARDVSISKISMHKIGNVGFLLTNASHINLFNNYLSLLRFSDKTSRTEYYFIGVTLVQSKSVHINSNEIIFNISHELIQSKNECIGVLLSSNNRNIAIENNNIFFNKLHQLSYGVWHGGENTAIEIKDNNIINAWYGIVSKDQRPRMENNKITLRQNNHYSEFPVAVMLYYDQSEHK